MTLDLAYSYCTGLSKDEEITIDIQVSINREKVYIFVRNLPSNGKDKTKKVIIVSVLGVALCFSNVQSSEAMGLSIPLAPVVRVQPSYEDTFELRTPKIIARTNNRIAYKSNKEILLLIYLTDPRISSNQQVLKIVNELRGGSRAELLGSAVFFGLLYVIWILSGTTESFVAPPVNPGWGLPTNLYNPPGLVRPADCETQLYAGFPTQSLKTWEDRNLPNPKDRWILVKSHLELVIRRGQSKFKTKDHGALAGLPYIIKKNGATSTLITEENVDVFMDVVERIVEDPNRIWFEEGTYQANTTREVESINIHNEEENRVAIFERLTGQFITFCEPTLEELEDLKATGNFGGQVKPKICLHNKISKVISHP